MAAVLEGRLREFPGCEGISGMPRWMVDSYYFWQWVDKRRRVRIIVQVPYKFELKRRKI